MKERHDLIASILRALHAGVIAEKDALTCLGIAEWRDEGVYDYHRLMTAEQDTVSGKVIWGILKDGAEELIYNPNGRPVISLPESIKAA